MSVLIDGNTKILCQGFTGEAGMFHSKNSLATNNDGTIMQRICAVKNGGQKRRGNGCINRHTVSNRLIKRSSSLQNKQRTGSRRSHLCCCGNYFL